MSVAVRVIAQNEKSIEGLQAGDFAVRMHGSLYRPCGLIHNRQPVSIGVILDTSGSMRPAAPVVLSAVESLLYHSGPQDQYFLVTANERPSVKVHFTNDTSRIRTMVQASLSAGETSLIDALYLALEQMRGARFPTRAIIVLSDGSENNSLHTFENLASAFAVSPVPIFVLCPEDPSHWGEEPSHAGLSARTRLLRFAEDSGGYASRITGKQDAARIAAELATAIRLPYELSVSVSADNPDPGAWKVEVAGIRPKPRLLYCRKCALLR